MSPPEFSKLVQGRLAYWCRVAETLETNCDAWRSSLPLHSRTLYTETDVHGPLLSAMHTHTSSIAVTATGVLPMTSLASLRQVCCLALAFGQSLPMLLSG